MARGRGLWRDVGGLSTVEYILILVIVAITGILLWQTFGTSVGNRVDQATQSVSGMDGRGSGAPGAMAAGDSAGAATAMAITEGRRGEMTGEGTSAMGGSAGGEASAEGAGRARRAGEAEGAAAGFDDSSGETADLPDDGPDLFLWIGWLLVLILGAATLFSVLGKRVGKGK